jgi:hypothetical protein
LKVHRTFARPLRFGPICLLSVLAISCDSTTTSSFDAGGDLHEASHDAFDDRCPSDHDLSADGEVADAGSDLFAEVGTAGWALPLGSGELHQPSATIDGAGNPLVALALVGSTGLGGVTYTSRGNADILVAKLSPAGEAIWVRQIGGSGADSTASVVANPASGDVIVAGYYQSALLDVEDSPTPLENDGAPSDLFIVSYAGKDGAWRWQKRISTGGGTYSLIGVDADGDVLLGGSFASSIDLGIGALTTSEGAIFFGKLDGNTGVASWQKKIGEGGQGSIFQSAWGVDSHGDFLMGGSFFGQVDLGGDGPDGDLASTLTDGFVAKFSGADGALKWQRSLGGPPDSGVSSMAFAPDDSVTLVAQYAVTQAGSVSFVGHPLSGSGIGTELVVGRLASADGAFVWARRFGGPGHEQGNSIATGADGRVAIAGGFTADFTMDDQSLPFEGAQEDSFFAVLDGASGVTIYAARVGSLDFDHGVATGLFERNLYGFGTVRHEGTFLGKTLTPPSEAAIGYGFQVTLP